MKTSFRLLVFAFVLLFVSNIQAQKVYTSAQLKLIFSAAPDLERNGNHINSPMRFSGFFNYSVIGNLDINKFLGVSIGVEVKNIGLIMKDSIFHTKHRAYGIGVPVYLRIGNMDERWYLFAGGQYDFMFAYKEKVFYDNSKTKRSGSNYGADVNTFIPTVFLGFRTKTGTSFSVNYMLDDFLSKDYRFKDPSQNNAPLIQGYTNSQIIYFTLGFMGDLDKASKTPSPRSNTKNASYYRNY